ncbi:MAG: hypothetical protein QY311_02910 [Candidatus Paceibacterota bacterium]|nr:MAG: hypothetical protein QY311_02910 [Candidatus Paceibacterota bacterium]
MATMMQVGLAEFGANVRPIAERTFRCLVHKREVTSRDGFVLSIGNIQKELGLPAKQLPAIHQLSGFVACYECLPSVRSFYGVSFMPRLGDQLALLDRHFKLAAQQVRARPIAPATVVQGTTTGRTGTAMPTLPAGYFERRGQAHKGRKSRAQRRAEAMAKRARPAATAAVDKKAAKKAAKQAAKAKNQKGNGGKKRH